jgi:hypothetical protein
VPQIEEVACLAQGIERLLRLDRRPVSQPAARGREVLGDLLLSPHFAQIGVGLDRVTIGFGGQADEAVADRDVAAIA